MSTKTTLKRIALVAVSALGFGLLSTVPSNGAAVTPAKSSGFSVNATSFTLVTNTETEATIETAASNYLLVEVSLRNTSGAAGPLASGESLTATTISSPDVTANTNFTTNADLRLEWATNWNAATGAVTSVDTSSPSVLNDSEDTEGQTYIDLDAADSKRGGLRTSTGTTVALNDYLYTDDASTSTATYALRISVADFDGLNDGFYQVRINLLDSNSNAISTQTIRFQVVSSKVNSGAVLTAASAGLFRSGVANPNTDVNYLSATLRDANGGLIREESNDTPGISATLQDAQTVRADAGAVTPYDDGSANDFNSVDGSVAFNGVYGLGVTLGTIPTAGQGNGLLTVRYGLAVATATVTIGRDTTALASVAAPTVSAVGLTATSSANTATAGGWFIPTSTKTAALSVFTGTAATAAGTLTNYPVTFTVTWTNGAAGDVTPKTATPTVVYSDAAGYATLNITNNTPVNGAVASVAISGFSSAGQPVTQTINWVAPGRQTTISISPASQRVATGTSTVVTATVTDRFGSPVAGVVLQPSLSTTSASYSTTAMPTVTTNASGQATVTLTAGANLTSDALTFTDVAGLATAASATYSYRTTVDTIASFLEYYDLNESTAAASVSTPVPSSGITQANGDYLSITRARDNSRSIALTTSTSNDMIIIRTQALTSASAGAVSRPVVVTGSEGVWIRSSTTGTAATSRTFVTDSNGFITFVVGSNKTGANTVTLTAGSVTDKVAFWTTNAVGDARYVTLTGAATGTANGDAIPFTATVTDRYGNPVSNVSLSIQASGVGVMGGGSTLQTFTTNSSGTFTFTGTSLNAAGGSATFTASAPSTGEFASAAGFSGSTAIDSTVTAGRNSSSVTVTFAPGVNAAQAAADAAADAAAEAIDAANAATDAANLAAEAADAATVAAEEARDAADAATAAVEELATQVATLMAALKAQITTLANTVAKIAKKVKA